MTLTSQREDFEMTLTTQRQDFWMSITIKDNTFRSWQSKTGHLRCM